MAIQPIRILIVDDHPAVRHGLSQLINSEVDFSVCGEAGDADGAIRAVRKVNPDLILLDISLGSNPSQDLGLISEISNINPRLPILIYSMHDEMAYAERALKMGASGYLMKQEPVMQVITAVRRIMEQGVYLSDTMTKRLIMRQIGQSSQVEKMRSPKDCLSKREFEVFVMVGKGYQPREIAERLYLSTKTIESHRLNIRKKLNLTSASDLTKYAVKWVHRSA